MFGQSFAYFPGQIEPGKIGVFLFEFFDDPQAVAIVLEAAMTAHEFVQGTFAAVPERGMTEIVRQRDGLGEVLVQAQGAGDVARDRGDFHRVREPGAEVIPRAVQEHLGLVFQPAKRARVDDAVAVPLELGAPLGRRLWEGATAGIGAELGERRQCGALTRFEFLASAGHGQSPARPIRRQRVASNSCTETPRSSNTRRMASSIRLFGQEAPAVMPTVMRPAGNQFCVSTSLSRCWL